MCNLALVLFVSLVASVTFAAEERDESPLSAHIGIASAIDSVTIKQGGAKFQRRAYPLRVFIEVPVRIVGTDLRIAPELSYQTLFLENDVQPFQQLEGQEGYVGGNIFWRVIEQIDVFGGYRRIVGGVYQSQPSYFKTSPDQFTNGGNVSFRVSGFGISLGAQWLPLPRVGFFLSATHYQKKVEPSFFFEGADTRYFQTARWESNAISLGAFVRG